jgi:hypothetical protein
VKIDDDTERQRRNFEEHWVLESGRTRWWRYRGQSVGAGSDEVKLTKTKIELNDGKDDGY